MKETISTRQVEQGMFVAELDRPWLETPFLLQGFLVDDAAQIAELQKYCASVTIDRSRSIGPHYAAVRYPAKAHHGDRVSRPAVAAQTAPDSFYVVCRTLREAPPRRSAKRTVPQVFGHDRQSQLETELLYSAPLVDDVKGKLQSIRQSIDANVSDKIKAVVELVSEMAESVERNPDAMIWLTRLRSSDEYSYDHAVDVSVHLMVLSRFLGMPAKTVEMLGQVGLMQDIGKINLPEAVLRKQEALTEEELVLVRSHVASSIEILRDQPDFSFEVLSIIGSHHERIDGSGYPRRIHGDKLGLHAELAGLIDCYCAMLRQRAYSSAVSSQQALEHGHARQEVPRAAGRSTDPVHRPLPDRHARRTEQRRGRRGDPAEPGAPAETARHDRARPRQIHRTPAPHA